jgi:hypothetical protein
MTVLPKENTTNLQKKLFLSGLQLFFCNIFEIKFVEVSETAVPAPDNKVTAADSKVVGTGDMAVPACSRFNELPEIITADLRELSFFTDILDPGDENPGSPAVVAGHLCLVRQGRDDLVSHFFTMVTVREVPSEDETFAHGR